MRNRAFGILISLLLITTSHAFDSKRKGFVLGGGMGFSPVSRISGSLPRVTSSQSAFGYRSFVGVGLTESNLLGAILSGDYYAVRSTDNMTVFGLFIGAGWIHYWGKNSGPFFTSLAIGRYGHNVYISEKHGRTESTLPESYWNSAGSGFGADIGAGIELGKFLQIGSGLMFARTTNRSFDPSVPDINTNHIIVNVTIGAMLF